jgi:hypothetical protein
VAIGGIVLYLLMYRKGRSANSAIIEQFYQRTRTYFFANFSHVGFTKNHGEEPFVAESVNEAIFYATGRYNVDSI